MNESGVFVFPGTLLERRDLAAAIAHNCTCRMEGLQVERCALAAAEALRPGVRKLTSR